MFPKLLYRGDSDQEGQRKLKSTFNRGLLLTNLISGGNETEIFRKSIGLLVNEHIANVWGKTHFLSFTTDVKIALHYGSYGKAFEEVYAENEGWDFAVFPFDTTPPNKYDIKEIETGIYVAQFYPTCKEFLPTFKLILIDALSHLKSISNKNNIDLTKAITKAKHDSEWLILPASPFGHNGEFTAKLDTACIRDKRVFRYE